jgi:hypothetical protein
MRLPEVKGKFAVGCYYTLKSGEGLNFKTSLDIKWYGWPFLMWKRAHRDREFKWYEYPWLLTVIAKHTFLKWIGQNG